MVFFSLFATYAAVAIGLGQRLILWPAIWLFPRRRTTLVRAWLRGHARGTLGLARVAGGMRFSVKGAVPQESCVVVMNHQSVLDIPLGLSLLAGPQAVIPTRDRYARGVPGISPLVRLAQFPLVSQGRGLTREEFQGLANAADRVARGELSMLIFPEGHRTRDGRIGRFMRGGLRIVLSRARRPVYCIVADGMTLARTTKDALAQIAGSNVQVTILGPFDPPTDDATTDAFIEFLHAQMSGTLDAMRASRHTTTDDRPHAVAG